MLTLLAFLCCTGASCLAAPLQPPEPTDPGLFPPLTGWTVTVDTVFYTPDNLYDLIDGAADVYLSYGFEKVYLADYGSGDGTEVRVELYRHNSTVNAFGIYSQERKPDYHFVAMGAQGYEDEGILNFLTGVYYVKLATHGAGPGVRRSLRAVAHAIARHLLQDTLLPSPLALFPTYGKITNGETYVADNFLGYGVLHSAYIAQYKGEKPFQMFIIPCESSAAARAMLEAYLKAVKQPAGRDGDGVMMVKDPHNGPVGLVLKGRTLAGILNIGDDRRREQEARRLEKGL
jgi:hypothetical protein